MSRLKAVQMKIESELEDARRLASLNSSSSQEDPNNP